MFHARNCKAYFALTPVLQSMYHIVTMPTHCSQTSNPHYRNFRLKKQQFKWYCIYITHKHTHLAQSIPDIFPQQKWWLTTFNDYTMTVLKKCVSTMPLNDLAAKIYSANPSIFTFGQYRLIFYCMYFICMSTDGIFWLLKLSRLISIIHFVTPKLQW